MSSHADSHGPHDQPDSMYQASVFTTPCGRWVSDPHHGHKRHCWVTVYLSDSMSLNSHTDSEIMTYVYQSIEDGKVTFADQALHCMGGRCMSLPVRWQEYPQDEAEVLIQAKRLAAWWLSFIRTKQACIDQRMLFEDLQLPAVHERQLRETPFDWQQPGYAGWYE